MRTQVINTIYYPDFKSFKSAIKNFFDNIDRYRNELKQVIETEFHLLKPNF